MPDAHAQSNLPTPKDLLAQVIFHKNVVSDLLTDLQLIKGGQVITLHVSFSIIYPLIAKRSAFDIHNADQHYDLACRKVMRTVAKFYQHLRYKLILATGTIGQLFNHLSYDHSRLNQILNRGESNILHAIQETLPHTLRKEVDAGKVMTAISKELFDIASSTTRSPLERSGLLLIADLINKNALIPQQLYSGVDNLLASLEPAQFFKSVQSEILQDRKDQAKVRHRDYSEDHFYFESCMSTANILTSVRLNDMSADYISMFCGTQKTRAMIGRFFNEDAKRNYSRHAFTLLYWLTILSENEPHVNDIDYMINVVKQKQENLNFAQKTLENALQHDSVVLSVEVSRTINSLYRGPFKAALGEGDTSLNTIAPEIKDLLRRSQEGDKKAAKEVIEFAKLNSEEQMRELFDHVSDKSIDPLLYAAPVLDDNERFRKIRAMARTLKAGSRSP
jgi:hypothetical protein